MLTLRIFGAQEIYINDLWCHLFAAIANHMTWKWSRFGLLCKILKNLVWERDTLFVFTPLHYSEGFHAGVSQKVPAGLESVFSTFFFRAPPLAWVIETLPTYQLIYPGYHNQGFLNLSWKKWQRVLLTRSIAILPTVFIAAFEGINDLTGLNDMLNVLMSMQLPFAVLPILAFTSNTAVMKEFSNGV